MAEEKKGVWSRLLRLLELVHLWVWIGGLVLAALGWLTALSRGLDGGWLRGMAIAFFFCLSMVVLNILLRYRERHRAEIRSWRDLCAAAKAAEEEAVAAARRAEVEAVSTIRQVEEEARKEKGRIYAAIDVVVTYRTLKEEPEERDRFRSMSDRAKFFYQHCLSEEQRDHGHTLYQACAAIWTAYEDKRPVEEIEQPVKVIARNYGLEDLV